MFSNRTLRFFTFFIKNTPDLTGKEKDVLLKRLKTETLEKTGKFFNLTEGRVRQIERSALDKIRSKTHQLTLFKKSKDG